MPKYHVTGVRILLRNADRTVTTLVDYPMDRIVPAGHAIGLEVVGHPIPDDEAFPFILQSEPNVSCPHCGIADDHPPSVRQWTQDEIGVISIGWKCNACGFEFGHAQR